MDLEELNLGEVCRTCKGISPNMRSLFEGYENIPQTPRIDEMLMACASVQVTFGDGLPSNICHICVEQLRSAFVFKHQCEKIDANLREFTTKTQVKIKNELNNSDVMESPNTLNNFLNKQSTKDSIEEDPLEHVAPKTKTDYILDNNQTHMTCAKCLKTFVTLEDHQCHKRICTDKMFKCKQCNKEYRTFYNLQRHERCHARRKMYVCRICNKMFTSRTVNLKRHLVIHLKEKPFSCKTCSRGFARIEHLHNHTPNCTGNAGYPCDICGKTYTREDTLELHKKIHDNQQTKLQTIENMDNIEDYYYQIDQDDDVIFSDHSDADIDNYFEPETDVTESQDTDKIKEEADVSYQDDKSIVSKEVTAADSNNDIDSSLDEDKNESMENQDIAEVMEIDETIQEVKVEDNEIDLHQSENDGILNFDDDNSGGDSTCSGYLFKKALVSTKAESVIDISRKNSSTSSKSLEMKLRCRISSDSQKNVKKEEPVEEYGEFPCPACQELFNTMSQLDKHARQNHKRLKIHKCPTCNKEFITSYLLKRHITSHLSVKLLQCSVCTKTFNRKDRLDQHQKVHERQSVACDICQKPFRRAHHLANHKASKHGIGKKIMDEKQLECPLCQKCFTTEEYQSIHMNEHNEKKEYQCTKCEKIFFSESCLTTHMRFHNQHYKSVLCSECGQTFSRNDYLVIHMRRHTGEKPFKCKYCGKGFPRTTDLTVHERYHTGEKPHLCTICGRGFGRAYNLTVHMRSHTGEKPYQCTYCDAAFAQSSDLKGHVRRHTGERFHCEQCTESFILAHLLTQHNRNVHGITNGSTETQTVQTPENPSTAIPEQKPVIP